MLMNRPFSTAVLFVALLATIAQADQPTSEVSDSLIAFNESFNKHASDHDIEGLVALYDEDAYWIAPGALPAQGRDGVPRQTITFLSENNGELTHTIDELFISGDGMQAVMMGVTDAAVPAADVAFTGTYIYVLRRERADAPWLVVLDMFNNHPTN